MVTQVTLSKQGKDIALDIARASGGIIGLNYLKFLCYEQTHNFCHEELTQSSEQENWKLAARKFIDKDALKSFYPTFEDYVKNEIGNSYDEKEIIIAIENALKLRDLCS